jgi:hypothetical protein
MVSKSGSTLQRIMKDTVTIIEKSDAKKGLCMNLNMMTAR